MMLRKQYRGNLDQGNAGLGLVKQNIVPVQLTIVTDGEKLVLDFGQIVSLADTTFKNQDHNSSFSGGLDLSAYTGRVFEFYNLSSDSGVDDFYINSMNVSAVPIPAAAFLFAPALLGFIGLRRRTNTAVA